MKKLLLTSAGLSKSLEGLIMEKIRKNPCEIKVLLVPTASTNNDGAREGISMCIYKLMSMGILSENIFVYHLGFLLSKNYTRTYSADVTNVPPLFRILSVQEMNQYDLLVFSGGDASVLLSEINRTGFCEVIKQAVENGLFYLGISAGSMVAAGNFTDSLGFIKNPIFVHSEKGTPCGDLPQYGEVYLTDTQAILIDENFAQIVE